MLGCKVERGDEMIEGYHVHLGGGWGQRQGIARLLFESIALEDVLELISAIVAGYQPRKALFRAQVFAGHHVAEHGGGYLSSDELDRYCREAV